jgi:cold shock CspA family protein/ribosome-associated translation inhibitor RaiA
MEMPIVPLQISFRNFEPSDFVSARIREEVAQLQQFYGGIIGCQVALELLTKRHQQGNLFRARVEVKVPGEDLVAGRDSAMDHAHEDAYVALRDAFAAAKRQLEDYVDRHRVRVHLREHKKPPRGKVIRIIRDDESYAYGFLATPDGREIYFHENSVLNNHFEDLEVGTVVRYAEEEGEKGPQASTVEMVRHPRRRAAS